MTRISALFFSRAMSKADLSNLLKAWTSAPYLISSSTTSRWWCSVAQCKAVIFSISLAFTSAPFCHKKVIFFKEYVRIFQKWDNKWDIKNIIKRISRINFKVLKSRQKKNWLSKAWGCGGKNTRVGSHSLFQGIFPTQGSIQESNLQTDSLPSERWGKLIMRWPLVNPFSWIKKGSMHSVPQEQINSNHL